MIGIFGGTFDPIHFGHLRPALEVMETLDLDEVRFVPAHIPPHRDKPGRATIDRAEMVALAIAGQPGFVLDTCELERDRPSYTVETLALMRERFGADEPLLLLLGSDAFAGLPDWHQWQRLLDLAHIVVMARPGDHPAAERFPAGWLDARLTDDAADLRRRPAGSILRLPVSQLDISATKIRAALHEGRSARYLLPDPLLDFIQSRQLYDQPL